MARDGNNNNGNDNDGNSDSSDDNIDIGGSRGNTTTAAIMTAYTTINQKQR